MGAATSNILLQQRNKQVFVAKKVCLSQQNVCREKLCLSWQNFCHNKYLTKDVFCCDKHVFVTTKVCLLWQNYVCHYKYLSGSCQWYMWTPQPPYFHLQTSYGGTVNIYATQVLSNTCRLRMVVLSIFMQHKYFLTFNFSILWHNPVICYLAMKEQRSFSHNAAHTSATHCSSYHRLAQNSNTHGHVFMIFRHWFFLTRYTTKCQLKKDLW